MTTTMLAAVGSAVAVAAAVAQLDGVDLASAGTRLRPRSRRAAADGGASAGKPVAVADRRAGTAVMPASWHRHAVSDVVGACVGLLVGGMVAGIAVTCCVLAGSVWRARRRADQRRKARERAAPALARSMADALRGGASVRSALAASAVDRSVPAVLRDALAGSARSVELGAPVEGSLAALADQGGPGLRLLCGTVVLHLEAGGPLARELRQVATDGEVALRIDEDRVAATAQARATVRVVAALPILALLGAEAASRDFLPKIASKPVPLAVLLVGFGLEATAIVAARAIVGGSR